MRNPSPPVKLAQAGEPGGRPGNGAAPNTPKPPHTWVPALGKCCPFFRGAIFLGCRGSLGEQNAARFFAAPATYRATQMLPRKCCHAIVATQLLPRKCCHLPCFARPRVHPPRPRPLAPRKSCLVGHSNEKPSAERPRAASERGRTPRARSGSRSPTTDCARSSCPAPTASSPERASSTTASWEAAPPPDNLTRSSP